MNEILSGEKDPMSREDIQQEQQLRPLSFEDFTGQTQVLDNLKIFCGGG